MLMNFYFVVFFLLIFVPFLLLVGMDRIKKLQTLRRKYIKQKPNVAAWYENFKVHLLSGPPRVR